MFFAQGMVNSGAPVGRPEGDAHEQTSLMRITQCCIKQLVVARFALNGRQGSGARRHRRRVEMGDQPGIQPERLLQT